MAMTATQPSNPNQLLSSSCGGLSIIDAHVCLPSRGASATGGQARLDKVYQRSRDFELLVRLRGDRSDVADGRVRRGAPLASEQLSAALVAPILSSRRSVQPRGELCVLTRR